jgi:hypothetical protein
MGVDVRASELGGLECDEGETFFFAPSRRRRLSGTGELALSAGTSKRITVLASSTSKLTSSGRSARLSK